MASVVISGDTSGTATLQAPAVAGNTILTLPTTSGTLITTASSEINQTIYMLAADGNSTATRNVLLTVGTWQIVLQDAGGYADGANHDFTVTRNGTVSTTTVTTSWRLYRGGGSGYGRQVYGTDNAVGTIVVASNATVTMSIAAPVVTGTGTPSTYSGAILWVSKTL